MNEPLLLRALTGEPPKRQIENVNDVAEERYLTDLLNDSYRIDTA